MRGALLLLMLWYGTPARPELAARTTEELEALRPNADGQPAAVGLSDERSESATSARAPSPDERIEWRDYDESVFAQARQEHKLVLLNLEAVWCHWCHVMEQMSYSRPEIRRFLTAHFIAVKVDQDARPDLAARYRDYGWPATILLDADGNDIAKRAGFLAPEALLRLLETVNADPTPEPAARAFAAGPISTSPLLEESVRAQLRARHERAFDNALGGLRTVQKFLDRDSVEWSLTLAATGNTSEAAMARRTLDAARALQDPVWGGFYQYSTRNDWQHPHFEKLAKIQAGYLRSYALAFGLWRQPRDLETVHEIVRYLDAFLTSPQGAFYTSQDADLVPGEHSGEYFALDDALRRARGVPRVDRHLYARENGWLSEALAIAYEFTADDSLLARSVRAAEWGRAQRRTVEGGYRHDAADQTAHYLADNLAMARAWLQLYRVTADRAYLAEAMVTGDYMLAAFVRNAGGVATVAASASATQAHVDTEENISFARFMNLLAHYTGQQRYRSGAESALRYLATERVALRKLTEPGILLAEREYANLPAHFTLVAAKDAAPARALHAAMLRVPGYYKRVEWWDEREGALPNTDVEYPRLSRPAAYVCTNQVCSLPLFEVADLQRFIALRLGLAPLAADAPTPAARSTSTTTMR